MSALLAVLLGLTIVAALVAICGASTLGAVIAVGAVGFMTAIAFLLLGAPDVAIVQVAVEVIALTILIRAVSGREPEGHAESGAVPDPEPGQSSLVGVSVAVTLIAIVGIFALRVFTELPPFGQPVMDRIAQAPSVWYLHEGLERTGAANIVSAVLLDFRGYDTLGEAAVLFCAVLGALSIARRRARTTAGANNDEEGT